MIESNTNKSKSNINEETFASSILGTMLKQEDSNEYRINCYFQRLSKDKEFRLNDNGEEIPLHTLSTNEATEVRKRIVEWCWKVTIDCCEYSNANDIIERTMSCLDRFLSKNVVDGISLETLLLAALSTLYIVIKTHCEQPLSLNQIASMSEGIFEKDDILAMERTILKTIQWKVNPPTSMEFMRLYLGIITANNDHYSFLLVDTIRSAIDELVSKMTNYSIAQYDIITEYRPSQIAFASLSNAIEYVIGRGRDDEDAEILYHTIYKNNEVILAADTINASYHIESESLRGLRRVLYKSILEVPSHEKKKYIVSDGNEEEYLQMNTNIDNCCGEISSSTSLFNKNECKQDNNKSKKRDSVSPRSVTEQQRRKRFITL